MDRLKSCTMEESFLCECANCGERWVIINPKGGLEKMFCCFCGHTHDLIYKNDNKNWNHYISYKTN